MAFQINGFSGGFAAASTSARVSGFPDSSNAFFSTTGIHNPFGVQQNAGALFGASQQLGNQWHMALGANFPGQPSFNFNSGFFPNQPGFFGSNGGNSVNFSSGFFPNQPNFFGASFGNSTAFASGFFPNQPNFFGASFGNSTAFGQGPFPNQPVFLGNGFFPFFQSGFFPRQPGFF